ncbi:MAG: hypothetical protein WA081_17800 [Desulfosalsimonadaceae bacterium]
MSRAADYTIKGFLYQFNKSALEILRADDSATINIEGVIEDIEVVTSTMTTGIQCKYHEASTGFTHSAIFKPLLQMLVHFAAHPADSIKYVLFAHFPGVGAAPPSVGKAECESALSSTDKTLKKYVDAVPSTIDIDRFLCKFNMEFGHCYDDLVAQVSCSLEDSGIPAGEIETLAYPNAINIIAGISILHDPAKRQITKKQFLDQLNGIRNTAISRWTMALKTKDKLLKARRKQLKVHLDKNSRIRYFVIDPHTLSDYETEIVLFISDYIEKYHFKTAHISTPVLCFFATRTEIQEIQHRLYTKGIVTTDGYVGAQFEEAFFFRDPFSAKGNRGTVLREFAFRVTDWDDHGTLLNKKKCDDLFILGTPDCGSLETIDVNVEHLSGATIKEIKFVMGVSDVYE